MVFKGGGDVRDFPGNYTQYRGWLDEKLQQERAQQKEQADRHKDTSAPAAASRNNRETKKKLSYKERREMETLEKEIAALEEEKKNIEDALCSGMLSVEEITEKSKRLPVVDEELDEKTMRWLELSEIEG